MNRRDLLWFLGIEIFAIIWAGAVFKIFDSKLVAGAFAGIYFVGAGLFILYRLWKWPNKWKSLTIYPALVHTFAVSIPMVVVRFSSYALAFEDIKIWGLPGPVFHQLSTTVFSILVSATLIDLTRTFADKQEPPK